MIPFNIDILFISADFYEGLYFAIAIGLGVFITRRQYKKELSGFKNDENLLYIALGGAILGARISHMLFWSYDHFFANPASIVYVWQGGLSITGGLYGGIFAAWLYSKVKKLDFYRIFAITSPVLLLAQGIGRIGCFLNGDAHGTVTDLPWGVSFPRYGFHIPSFKLDTSVSSHAFNWAYSQGLVDAADTATPALHPTQIYEMLGDFLLAGIIFWLYTKLKKAKQFKTIFFLHTGGYALLRYGLEYIRADRAGIVAFGTSALQFVLLLWGIYALVQAGLHLNKAKENLQ